MHYPRGLISSEDFENWVHLPKFTRQWNELGLSEIDLDALKVLIMLGPDRAPMVRGTGGLRKLRFSPTKWNVGKSGALRIGYAYSESRSIIVLVTAYAKHDKANMTAAECRQTKAFLRELWKRI